MLKIDNFYMDLIESEVYKHIDHVVPLNVQRKDNNKITFAFNKGDITVSKLKTIAKEVSMAFEYAINGMVLLNDNIQERGQKIYLKLFISDEYID